MQKNKKIEVKGMEISLLQKNNDNYISLTDIARYKDVERTDYILQNWMRNRDTIEFLGLWEKINNSNFKPIEFDGFKTQSGLNSFSLTPKRWIESTNAIGLISKSGRYGGGTFAHKDIAFEFASWISPEFKLYLIKEFQRLKEIENQKSSLSWDVKRELARINYKIHTDAIKQKLIPLKIDQIPDKFVYASEGDLLNKALFNLTAKEWREQNPEKEGNIRDYSTIEQLVVLSNLESLNAELIKQGIEPEQRLLKLNKIAIDQIKSILGHPALEKLK
ncbi:DNA-binding protein [Candidatus Peregrinibacteria bacterium RIFCSPLOWO2_01_FULL_39_12]|nr:MAG: DNA-binding protein [Candidatus Peregrinibacteria bacterium RIFCSPLOWO2_01_FULL_39_12]